MIINIIKQDQKKILIIDNYIDNTVLDMLSKKNKNVEAVIFSSQNCNLTQKDHYLSISQLPKEQVEELKIIKEELKKVFEQNYGKSVFYEHGALSCSAKGGCCSDHAHLHIVAVDIDVKDHFNKYGYELREIEDYNEIVNQKQRNTPYLYYENQKGEMFIADAPVVESQFIRKLIAKDIDALDRSLWNENIRKDWMIEIVKNLRPHFEKLKGTSIWE